MNLQGLRDLSASLLDDLGFEYYTTEQLDRYLNIAQRRVQKLLIQASQNYYLKCASATIPAGVCSVPLPGDFLKTHRVEWITQGVPPNEVANILMPITIQQQDLMVAGPSTPVAFYFKRNRMVLVPAPAQEQQLRLTYSYRVTDMLLPTQVPDVPEEYHELISFLAVQMGFVKDDRSMVQITELMKDYEWLFKQDSQQRAEDKPREVVVTQDDGFSPFVGFF